VTRVPDAVRHSSCRSAEPGPYRTPAPDPGSAVECGLLLGRRERPGRLRAALLAELDTKVKELESTPTSARFDEYQKKAIEVRDKQAGTKPAAKD